MPKFFVTQKQINENNIKIIGQECKTYKKCIKKSCG